MKKDSSHCRELPLHGIISSGDTTTSHDQEGNGGETSNSEYHELNLDNYEGLLSRQVLLFFFLFHWHIVVTLVPTLYMS